MKINKAWHQKHKMPKNPSIDDRIRWHVAHAKNCGCRKIEGKLLEEITKRGIKLQMKKVNLLRFDENLDLKKSS